MPQWVQIISEGALLFQATGFSEILILNKHENLRNNSEYYRCIKMRMLFQINFIQLRYSEKINASSLCLMMGCLKRRGHYFWYLAPLNIEHMLHWLCFKVLKRSIYSLQFLFLNGILEA